MIEECSEVRTSHSVIHQLLGLVHLPSPNSESKCRYSSAKAPRSLKWKCILVMAIRSCFLAVNSLCGEPFATAAMTKSEDVSGVDMFPMAAEHCRWLQSGDWSLQRLHLHFAAKFAFGWSSYITPVVLIQRGKHLWSIILDWCIQETDKLPRWKEANCTAHKEERIAQQQHISEKETGLHKSFQGRAYIIIIDTVHKNVSTNASAIR